MNEIRSCAFTGHRPKSFSFGYDETDPAFTELKNRMRSCVIQALNAGCRRFYCGMAEGVDLWCGEIVLELMDRFTPKPELVAVVPFYNQDKTMRPQFRERFHRIMIASSARFLVNHEYHKDCFRKRNQFLVDSCDALIAVYKPDETISGTMQTIHYAERKGRKIFRVIVS
ncbi:MAG: DUF1273 family protein [Clostridia bacterium]|nr:DUF1273 family protein [Clostridia bacterium]